MSDTTNTTVADGDETINNSATGRANDPATGDEKTFTQSELNAIIGERLSKERSKIEADVVKREQNLAQRELAISAKEALQAKGYAPELLDALNYSSKEALENSLAIIEKQFGKKNDDAPKYGFRIGSSGQERKGGMMDPVKRAMGLDH